MTRVRKAALMLLAVVGLTAAAAPSPQSSVGPLAYLPALKGDYFPLASQATGRTYHIYVRLPPDYDPARAERYPIVYLLDGDSLFPLLAADHLFIAMDDKLPEAIVVGIAYGSFDPAVNKRDVDYNPDAPGQAASAFARFLRSELLPLIESRYAADPARRILFGQSFGGTFVLYSAFTEPDTFWGRIASNPSFRFGRDLFFGPAPHGSRHDLKLVVVSGSANNAAGRADALAWFEAWQARQDAPWAVLPVTVEGGTHAANSPDAYRLGLRLLFRPMGGPPAR